jgi:hypothetical protein
LETIDQNPSVPATRTLPIGELGRDLKHLAVREKEQYIAFAQRMNPVYGFPFKRLANGRFSYPGHYGSPFSDWLGAGCVETFRIWDVAEAPGPEDRMHTAT